MPAEYVTVRPDGVVFLSGPLAQAIRQLAKKRHVPVDELVSEALDAGTRRLAELRTEDA